MCVYMCVCVSDRSNLVQFLEETLALSFPDRIYKQRVRRNEQVDRNVLSGVMYARDEKRRRSMNQ